MIWIILFSIIILVSAVLAFRSMKDFEEFHDAVASNGLFYIAKPDELTTEVLQKLHTFFKSNGGFFSLEQLNKGSERALAIFGPVAIANNFPELKLIEIEDYLADSGSEWVGVTDKKVSVNQTLTWVIDPKSISKKNINAEELNKTVQIKDTQKLFLQSVCIPENATGTNDFQSTLRIMIVDPNPSDRVDLAKRIAQEFEKGTGFKKLEDNFPEQKKFDSFKQRSLVPAEVAPFVLNEEDLKSFFRV